MIVSAHLQQLMPEFLAYARSITSASDSAEDLVQDAIERALRSNNKPDVLDQLRPWMFRREPPSLETGVQISNAGQGAGPGPECSCGLFGGGHLFSHLPRLRIRRSCGFWLWLFEGSATTAGTPADWRQ